MNNRVTWFKLGVMVAAALLVLCVFMLSLHYDERVSDLTKQITDKKSTFVGVTQDVRIDQVKDLEEQKTVFQTRSNDLFTYFRETIALFVGLAISALADLMGIPRPSPNSGSTAGRGRRNE